MTHGIHWQSSGENSALPLQGTWIQFLVGEQRSGKLCGAAEKKKEMNLSVNQKQTQGHRGQTCGCHGGRDWKRDRLGGWG